MRTNLRSKILKYFSQIFSDDHFQQRLQLTQKTDKTLVSQVDYYLSDLIKKEIFREKKYAGFSFLSEEEHDNQLKFPTAILDPIDGTMEMTQGIPECAVSLGLFHDSSLHSLNNECWIFNPFTGMEIFSLKGLPAPRPRHGDQLLGMVSRREWNEGTFQNFSSPDLVLFPKGSIAFKLGLLAGGACDFVVSLRPKNIWDIAAGSALCAQRGWELYEAGKRVTHLDKMLYGPPLLWCRERDFQKLREVF